MAVSVIDPTVEPVTLIGQECTTQNIWSKRASSINHNVYWPRGNKVKQQKCVMHASTSVQHGIFTED